MLSALCLMFLLETVVCCVCAGRFVAQPEAGVLIIIESNKQSIMQVLTMAIRLRRDYHIFSTKVKLLKIRFKTLSFWCNLLVEKQTRTCLTLLLFWHKTCVVFQSSNSCKVNRPGLKCPCVARTLYRTLRYGIIRPSLFTSLFDIPCSVFDILFRLEECNSLRNRTCRLDCRIDSIKQCYNHTFFLADHDKTAK